MRCPVLGYVKFSTDGFRTKHLLGVFDSEELIHDGPINATASYAVCDELERLGWRKVGHSHDLVKDGVGIRIRHDILGEDLFGLDPISDVVAKATRLCEKMLEDVGKVGGA